MEKNKLAKQIFNRYIRVRSALFGSGGGGTEILGRHRNHRGHNTGRDDTKYLDRGEVGSKVS